ncbi:D-alanyl-D-alanine carboxypeptidase family protein [Caldalkalibacillus salinus]|uniref:D-alanyl-D-alanine carboxypeptidase family protein n=1 Tax=Caldalkalibacillus salinus TaxID=2803787 RepID=UPI001923E53E|nr:D-alanyl-D-alanine carboxypeptidase family protein [Caldalkalibacillus salinus]
MREHVVPQDGRRPKSGTILRFTVLILCIFFTPSSLTAMAKAEEPRLQSETAILIDGTTGDILYEKNAHQQMYPASITKIVTGIVAIEQGDTEEIVTVSENARNVIGTRVYLEEGEQVPLLKLIQGLLMASGNDAGTAIAEHFDHTEEAFSQRMNAFVRETVGVKDTHFTNPHGLFDDNHYTTAYDMAMMTQYAMENEVFREVVGTNSMEWVGEAWETTIYNHNRLIRQYDGATGVKNGYVRRSGHTLVGAAKREDTELIAVTLGAPSADAVYKDMTQLLDYGFKHYKTLHMEQGKVYRVEDRVYRVPHDTAITVDRVANYRMEVNANGLLSVKTVEGETLAHVLLQDEQSYVQNNFYSAMMGHRSPLTFSQDEVAEAVVASVSMTNSNDSDGPSSRSNRGMYTVIGGLIIVSGLVFLYLRRRRQRKRRLFY